MSLGPRWRRTFRLPLGRRSIERDVDDELSFHLAMREEKLRGLGLEPAAAEARARERFGDAERVRDECITIGTHHAREVRFMEWLESVLADFRFALRTFRRMPTFTIVATITLALGIGATSAMFTLVNGILLRPLPYPNAGRLVRLIQSYPEKGLDTWGISQVNIALYRDRATDFEAFAAYRSGSITLRLPNGPARLSASRVTADFFHVLGVNPAFGRAFTREEDTPGKNTVVLLSHDLWQTRFGGDSSILGKTLEIDEQPLTIVGVMPAGFAFPRPEVKLWIPMGLDPTRRFGFTNSGLGLIKPGVSLEHVRRQTTAIMWDWARSNGTAAPEKTRMSTIVTPLQEAITGRSERPLTVLLAAVSLILLIATANVATLLSSRAATREREIGVRTALGATGSRVLRQLLTESVALALVGAVIGTAIAYASVRMFTHSTLASLPRLDEVHVDARVLAFTLIVSVGSGLLFGLLPAVHAKQARLLSGGGGQRESSRRTTRRLNYALVVAQLSLSVVLLVAAGLVLKSFHRLTDLDLGFRAEGVTSIAFTTPSRIGTSALATNAFVTNVLQRVRAIPGVQSAALGWSLPLEGNSNVDGFLIEGRPVPPTGNESQIVQTGVSPEFFTTLGIPLLAGRDFTAADDSGSVPVAVVNDVVAKRYWTTASALGKRIRVTGDTTWFTIVGVVGSVRDLDAATPPWPQLYVSLPQSGGSAMSLAVRTKGDPASVIPAVRRSVAAVEPAIPLEVRPLSSVIDQSLAARRLTKTLLMGFALLAVILAAVGIYGVMSLYVANRKREFGIRLAVGAEPRAIVRLVLGEGALLAGVGVALGVVGAFVATRWIATLLYEVSPTDPLVFVSLPLLLAAIAVASCAVPARRAARSDPLAVLRAD